MLVRVYTCQNATLLEITCHGSILYCYVKTLLISTNKLSNSVDLGSNCSLWSSLIQGLHKTVC